MLADLYVQKGNGAGHRGSELRFIQNPCRFRLFVLLGQQFCLCLRERSPIAFDRRPCLIQLLAGRGAGLLQFLLPTKFPLGIGQIHSCLLNGGSGAGYIRSGAAQPGLIILPDQTNQRLSLFHHIAFTDQYLAHHAVDRHHHLGITGRIDDPFGQNPVIHLHRRQVFLIVLMTVPAPPDQSRQAKEQQQRNQPVVFQPSNHVFPLPLQSLFIAQYIPDAEARRIPGRNQAGRRGQNRRQHKPDCRAQKAERERQRCFQK